MSYGVGQVAYWVTGEPIAYLLCSDIGNMPHFDWDECGLQVVNGVVYPKYNQQVVILSERIERLVHGVATYCRLIRTIGAGGEMDIVPERCLAPEPFEGYFKDYIASKPNDYMSGYER